MLNNPSVVCMKSVEVEHVLSVALLCRVVECWKLSLLSDEQAQLLLDHTCNPEQSFNMRGIRQTRWSSFGAGRNRWQVTLMCYWVCFLLLCAQGVLFSCRVANFVWLELEPLLWSCWLGLLTCKTVSQITYTVLCCVLLFKCCEKSDVLSIICFYKYSKSGMKNSWCKSSYGWCSNLVKIHNGQK